MAPAHEDRPPRRVGERGATKLGAYRVIVWVLPVLVFFVTKRVCRELLEGEAFAQVREAAEENV